MKPLALAVPPSRAEQCADAIQDATREIDDLTVALNVAHHRRRPPRIGGYRWQVAS
jgi:hypothetical protein